MKSYRMLMLNKNFIILLVGALVNAIGSGIFLVSAMLLVYERTNNVMYTGLAMFAISSAGALGFLLAPLANYRNYKNSLAFTNFLKAMIVLTLPILYLTNEIHIWYLISILFVASMLTQYTYPIESTLLPIIVGVDEIFKANSLIQIVRQIMDIVFIAVAGILVLYIGYANSILITSTCMLFVSIIYLFLKLDHNKLSKEKKIKSIFKKYYKDLKDGFEYINNTRIPKMLWAIVFINTNIAIMMSNMPDFVLNKEGGNEVLYGVYLSSISLGIMLGAFLAPKLKTINFGILIGWSFVTSGILWIGAVMLNFWISILLFCIGSISIGILNLVIFSSIQSQVDTLFIGRVITIMSSSAAIGLPVGSLLGGVVGNNFNSLTAIIITGIAMSFFGVFWLLDKDMRKIGLVGKINLIDHDKIK